MTWLSELVRQYRLHRRMETDSAYWHRVNRWHELADYNSRVSKGIVHEPWYEARMRREQDAFDAETEAEREARLDPTV